MTIHACSFNGGAIVTPGVAATLTRAYDTWDETGALVPSGSPRFAANSLLVGAPDITVHDATAENQFLLGSGEWTDGTTPCAVVFKSSNGVIDVYVGPIDAANRTRFNIVHSGGGLGGHKASQVDVLKDSPGADGEQSDRVYFPRAGLVCNGLVLLQCEGRHYNAGPFDPRTTALIALDTSGGAGAWRWRLVYESAVVQAGQSRGQYWALQNGWMPDAVADGTPVLSVWVAYVDYRLASPSPTGGVLFLVQATRADAASPWVIGQVQTIFEIIGATGLHLHSACVMRYGASGLRIFVSAGDTYFCNRVIEIAREDESYVTGTPDIPAAGTYTGYLHVTPGAAVNGWTVYDGVSGTGNYAEFTGAVWTNAGSTLQHSSFNRVEIDTGAVLWLTGGTGVTNPTPALVVSRAGDILTLDRDINGGSGNTSDVSGRVPGDRANQFVGLCIGRDSGELFIGADENTPAIYRSTPYAAAGKRLQFDSLHGPMTTHRKGWVCFAIHCAYPHRRRGGWVAGVAPNSLTADGWSTRNDAHSVVYSADGLHWGYAFRPNFFGPYNFAFFAGGILMGSVSTGLGLRSTPIPASKVMRPLCVGKGATNYMETALTQRTAPSSGNTLTLVSAANVSQATREANLAALGQGTIPNPASNGAVYRLTRKVGTHGGIHSMGSNTPDVPRSKLKVRIGIYALAPKDGDGPNTPPYNAVAGGSSFTVGHANATDAFSSFARATYDSPESDARGWQWLTIEADPVAWAGGGAVPNPFTPAIQLWKQGTNQIRDDLLICFDSIVAGATVDLPSVPPQVGSANPVSADESGSIVFPATPSTSWSVRIAARVPANAWDQYSLYRPSGLVMMTLWESGSAYYTVILDPANNRIRINDSGGGTFVDVTAPAGEVFAFLRGGQILLALTLSGTTLTAYASVAGSSIGSASGTVSAVRPTRVVYGDHNGANLDSFDLFGVLLNDAAAEDGATVRAALRTLDWVPTNESDLNLLLERRRRYTRQRART